MPKCSTADFAFFNFVFFPLRNSIIDNNFELIWKIKERKSTKATFTIQSDSCEAGGEKFV